MGVKRLQPQLQEIDLGLPEEDVDREAPRVDSPLEPGTGEAHECSGCGRHTYPRPTVCWWCRRDV